MTKFEEAARTVNAWVSVNNGQAGFDWQHGILTKMNDLTAARQLTEWWNAHPANTK